MDFEFIIAGEKLFQQQNGGKVLSKVRQSQKDYWPVTRKSTKTQDDKSISNIDQAKLEIPRKKNI